MAGIKYNHNMFTVGMISEKIQGNTESETYNNSLLDCKNFYIRQTGGVFKRPGTFYVSVIQDALRMKLYPYNFPGNNSIVIGILPGEIYAYDIYGEITKCTAGDLSLDVINDEHFTVLQNGNFLYIFSKVGIFELSYETVSRTLSFKKKEFTFSPVGKVNDIPDNTATFSKETNTITLNGGIKFVNSDIGQRCLLFWEGADDKLTSNKIQAYSYFKISAISNGGANATVTWEKEYSSFDSIDKVPATGTYHFSIPAFGADRGWPIAAGILSNRLFLADNDLVIYGSCVRFDDIFDFTLGPDENSAISYRMNNDVGTINWIIGQDKLFVGSPTGIYISGGSGAYQDEVLTSANMSLKKFSSVHASTLTPTNINANIVFTDALSKNVYEISVDEATGTYKTYDLSLLSNELLNSRCISQTWSSYPVKTYWVVCQDGTLASMTYEKANNVLAWSYHELGGINSAVESCASIQIDGYDYVFLVVRRNVNGTIVRFVEYIDKLYEPLDKKQYQQHYADAGLDRKYEYHLADISQYTPPQINGIDDWEFEQIEQNENARTQYVELALLDTDNQRAIFNLYADKTWRVLAYTGTITNYVSFCDLEVSQKSTSVDGIQRTYIRKRPLNVNNIKFDNCNIAISKTEITGVKYDKNHDVLILFCDGTYFENGDNVILRGTGIKDLDGNSLDSTEEKYIPLMVYSNDVSAYTTDFGIIIKRADGTDTGYTAGSFINKGNIYRYKSANKYKIEHGSNAIVTQHVPLAEAVALSELPDNQDMPQSGVCGGVIWDNEKEDYLIAQGQAIYEVLPDFSKWLKARNTSSDVKALIGNNAYCTAAIFINEKATVAFGGIFQKYTGEKENTYYFITGGTTASINGNSVSKNEQRSNVTAAILLSESKTVQWFAPNGVYGCWNSTDGETELGALPGEIRNVNGAITFNNKVYIVGDEGLFYERPEDNLHDWIYLENNHVCDWKGIVGFQNKLLLWSKNGEILLFDPGENKYYFQTISISSEISGCYVANDRIFLALTDGMILRSVSESQYTQTFFDLAHIYIDDVVGMEGINGKKLLVKNIDTSSISEGLIKYEIWDDKYPVDTRGFGVYDTTVTNNGTVHVYFNKLVGLGHLAGQKVTVALDGNFLAEDTVSASGVLSFGNDIYGMEAHVGYKYNGVLELMPLSGGNVRGSSVGSVGSQKSAFARLYYSLGGTYGTEEDNMYKIVYPTNLTKGSYDKTKELYSGVIELPIVNPRDIRERKFRMEHSDPVSFNVLSITQDAEISDA